MGGEEGRRPPRLLGNLGADGCALAARHGGVEEALLGLGKAQRREHRRGLDRGVRPCARDERLGGYLPEEGEDAGGGLQLRRRRLVAWRGTGEQAGRLSVLPCVASGADCC